MGLHPCCGGSLQTGAKIVAILEMICSILIIIFAIVVFVSGAAVAGNSDKIAHEFSTSHEGHDEHFSRAVAVAGVFIIVYGVVTLIIGIAYLILGIILLKGAQQRSVSKCKLWLIIQCICLAFTAVLFLIQLFGIGGTVGGILINLFPILLSLYFIWIVYAFWKELQQEEEGGRLDPERAKQVSYTNN